MSLENNIIQQAQAYGLSPEYLLRLAQVESNNNPAARNPNSSATGAFQFIDKTWLDEMSKAGLVDQNRLAVDPSYKNELLAQRGDPAISSRMAAQFAARNRDTLKNVLGRDPADVEMYMAHFLGPGGAKTFFEGQGADGNAPAHENLRIAADANKNVFFNRDGTARSYNDILNKFGEKFPVNTGLPPLMDMGNVATAPQPVPADEGPIQTTSPPSANRRDAAMLAEGLKPPEQPQGDENAARMLLNISSGFLGGNGFFDGASRAAAGASQAIGQNQQQKASQLSAFTRLVASGVDPKQAVLALSSGDLGSMQNIQMADNKSQQGNSFYTPDGSYVKEIFNKQKGRIEYHNANTGQVMQTLPAGSFRTEQSPFKEINKQSGQDINEAYTAANESPGRQQQLERLRGLATSAAGPDVLARAGRAIAETLGVKIGNFDPANISQARKEISDMAVTAASRMRGQGQITENERKLLMDTLPTLDSNPQALNAIIDIMLRAEKRKIEQVKAWRGAGSEEKKDGWQAFQFAYREKLDEAEGKNPAASTPSPTGGAISPAHRSLIDKYTK